MSSSIAVLLAALAVCGAIIIVQRQLSRKLDEIHQLVNSNLSKVQADLSIALDRIEVLEHILSKRDVQPESA